MQTLNLWFAVCGTHTTGNDILSNITPRIPLIPRFNIFLQWRESSATKRNQGEIKGKSKVMGRAATSSAGIISPCCPFGGVSETTSYMTPWYPEFRSQSFQFEIPIH
jgi:hypothetical protein